jgi:HSP20 family molecular chaperone IbpA
MASTQVRNLVARCGALEKRNDFPPTPFGALKTEQPRWKFNTPMEPIRNIKLRWLHGALQDVTYELSRSHFSRFAPHGWEPAINAYRCEKSIRICVDLAGVDRAFINLTVEPRRVVIRGTRELPEPTDDEGCALQLLAMEIDYGPFIREVPLPAEVEIEQAHAEQRNGLLWISLPLKES